jgi:hypothetical protein
MQCCHVVELPPQNNKKNSNKKLETGILCYFRREMGFDLGWVLAPQGDRDLVSYNLILTLTSHNET